MTWAGRTVSRMRWKFRRMARRRISSQTRERGDSDFRMKPEEPNYTLGMMFRMRSGKKTVLPWARSAGIAATVSILSGCAHAGPKETHNGENLANLGYSGRDLTGVEFRRCSL